MTESGETEILGQPGVAEGEYDDLILWMLSLTPTQRLEVAQGVMDIIVAVRNGRRHAVLPILYRTLQLKKIPPEEK